MREAFEEARDEMAQLPGSWPELDELPIPRIDFYGAPSMIVEQTRVIQDAAASIHSAAYALQAAGVFQGVAKQIADRADAIEHACAAQENALARTSRMAALLSEVEAELIAVFDEVDVPQNSSRRECDVHPMPGLGGDRRLIPSEVVAEISAALAECAVDEESFKPRPA
jgi:hypothetical protein